MTQALLHRLAICLTVLLIVLPPFVDVAEAQSAPISAPSDVPEIEDVNGVAIAQVEVLESVDGRVVINATIGYGGRSTNVEIQDGDILFADGYAIRTRDAGSDVNRNAILITAESPDGRTETAIIRQNIATGEAASDDLTEVRGLLSESGKLDLVAAGMPVITAMAGDKLSQDLRPKRTGWLNCTKALLFLAGSVIAVIAACAIPEPAQPVACWGAVIMLLGAFVEAVQSCNFPDRCKDPC
jgi:hypothetical protein